MKPLAVLGGTPAFEHALYVGRPNIGDRNDFLARLNDALDRRWLTNDGQQLLEFQRRLAEFLGVTHAIAVCNATIALEIASRALDFAGEVIVPSFTFIATAHCLQWQGITPVFGDVDPASHNMGPEQVEAMITPRTTGIIGVHLWGRPCDVQGLEDLARRRGLRLLFDAAHAFGVESNGRRIGNFGDAEVFSFHATKVFNTFEGGAIATNDDDLARRIRLMRNFGFVDYDDVRYVGTNGKMTEVSAAMGLTNLASLGTFVADNRAKYEAYVAELSTVAGLRIIDYSGVQHANYHYVVAEIDEQETGLSRDEIYTALHRENIIARRYFHPGCHRMEPYRTLFPDAGRFLPHTEALTTRVLALPSGAALTLQDIALVCAVLRRIQDSRTAVRAALRL